jgi:hypothetical protein
LSSSSPNQTGFQYWPVASITTWVTPLAASQATSASNPEVNVGKRPHLMGTSAAPVGARTQVTTLSLGDIHPAQHE